jgi:hypothetical protein
MLTTLALFVSSSSPAQAAPKSEVIEGVRFHCVNQIRHELIRDFARENSDDPAALAEWREFVRTVPAYACRSRKNPSQEDVS